MDRSRCSAKENEAHSFGLNYTLLLFPIRTREDHKVKVNGDGRNIPVSPINWVIPYGNKIWTRSSIKMLYIHSLATVGFMHVIMGDIPSVAERWFPIGYIFVNISWLSLISIFYAEPTAWHTVIFWRLRLAVYKCWMYVSSHFCPSRTSPGHYFFLVNQSCISRREKNLCCFYKGPIWSDFVKLKLNPSLVSYECIRNIINPRDTWD